MWQLPQGAQERFERMKYLKSQAWRALLALGALTASGLVLEAGRRWF